MARKVLLWRWRRNPLRRLSDRVEAWAVLVSAVLLLCVAPAAGWFTGHAADQSLQRTARAQRAERSEVPATVVRAGWRGAGGSAALSDQAIDPRLGSVVRWSAPDGTARTGTVRIDAQQMSDGRLRIWTDRSGRIAEPPLDSATARTQAALAGLGVAAATSVVVVAARDVLLWQLMRRRLREWERAWTRISGDWGRAGAGGQG